MIWHASSFYSYNQFAPWYNKLSTCLVHVTFPHLLARTNLVHLRFPHRQLQPVWSMIGFPIRQIEPVWSMICFLISQQESIWSMTVFLIPCLEPVKSGLQHLSSISPPYTGHFLRDMNHRVCHFWAAVIRHRGPPKIILTSTLSFSPHINIIEHTVNQAQFPCVYQVFRGRPGDRSEFTLICPLPMSPCLPVGSLHFSRCNGPADQFSTLDRDDTMVSRAIYSPFTLGTVMPDHFAEATFGEKN